MNIETTGNKVNKLDKLISYGLLFLSIFSCFSKSGALAALLFTFAMIVIRHGKLPYRTPVPRRFMGVYTLFLLLLIPSLIIAPDHHAAIRTFLIITFYIFTFFLAWFGIHDKKQIVMLISGLALSLTISSSSIIYQAVASGFDLSLRFDSFGYFCMITSGFMAVILPLLWLVVLEHRGINSWLKTALIAAIIIGTIALLLNMNRGVWTSIIAVIFIYLLVRIKVGFRWMIIMVSLISLCIMGMFAVPQINDRARLVVNDGLALTRSYRMIFQENTPENLRVFKEETKGLSIPDRIFIWQGAWRMFKKNPWNGVGLGMVEKTYKSGRGYISPLVVNPHVFVHAHNNFLQFLASSGIFGFLGFSSLFAYILWMFIRRYKKNPVDLWSLAGLLVTVSFLIQGMTEYNYAHAALVRLFWFILGICMAASRLSFENVGENGKETGSSIE